MTAPDRIWAKPLSEEYYPTGKWEDHASFGGTEYIRADLVPQWMPIETAPKDGSQIVLARFVRTENYLVVEPLIMVGSWIDKDFCVLAGIFGGEVSCITRFSAPWTHWMPLPNPPPAT